MITNLHRNRLPIVASVLVALTLALTSCAANSAEPTRRIIAMGDLHGDYDAYRALLREAKLTDKRGRWIGGDTIFVQTGDVPDRGPDSLKIIEDLQRLQKRAVKDGGEVVTLIGNHEAMNVTGDLRYVHPGEYEAFKKPTSKRFRDAVYEANREAIEEAGRSINPEASDADIREDWMEQIPLGRLEHRQAWGLTGNVGEWIAGNKAVAIIDGNLFLHLSLIHI